MDELLIGLSWLLSATIVAIIAWNLGYSAGLNRGLEIGFEDGRASVRKESE